MSKKTKKRGKKHLEGRLQTLSPGDDDTQAHSALPAMPRRTPWRTVGADIVSLGAPVGIGVLHPLLGELIATVDVVVVLTIIGTALFGSQALSERAFRLLRWIGNRSEPLGPPSDHPDADGHMSVTARHRHRAPRSRSAAHASYQSGDGEVDAARGASGTQLIRSNRR
jgi:hypothetical protein